MKTIKITLISIAFAIIACFAAEAASTDQLVFSYDPGKTITMRTFDGADNLVEVSFPARQMMDYELQFAPSSVFDWYTRKGGMVCMSLEPFWIDGVNYGGYCWFDSGYIKSTYYGATLYHEVSHYVFEQSKTYWTSVMWAEFSAMKAMFPEIVQGIDLSIYSGIYDSEFFARLSTYLYVETTTDFWMDPDCIGYEAWNAPGGAREMHNRGRAFLNSVYAIL